ncbi:MULTISPECIES: glycine zipper domain-containing protein [unclassified Caballeronia]|uniref:glycine zipper domain-containing protein n=1 Tax=unclassified Caballeronia TaxID=2646786 RepID=UPI00158A5E17|nr:MULTISPECIES: glycine zipper domain-containing protein [unclassified Caballeronia]QSN63508.1 hypothetical protein JYK05_14905 [Caballeronia sp. M1242]
MPSRYSTTARPVSAAGNDVRRGAPAKRTPSSAFLLSGIAVLCLAFTGGCASDADTTRAEGAGAGAVIGGAIGALIGHGKAGGIVAGAAAGGLAGGLYGNHVANQKQAYATREDQLQASIAHAQQVASQARAYNQQLQAQIAALEQTRQQLRRQVVSADTRQQAMLDERRKTAAMIARTNAELTNVRQEIATQQTVLRTASTDAAGNSQQSPEIQKVSSNIGELQKQALALEQAQTQLQMIDQRRSY